MTIEAPYEIKVSTQKVVDQDSTKDTGTQCEQEYLIVLVWASTPLC